MNERLLLDTCAVVKWVDGTMPGRTRQILERSERRYFSVVSAWEIQLKPGLRNRISPEELDIIIGVMGLEVQPLLLDSVRMLTGIYRLAQLPHMDPFDHILIAQAMMFSLPIVTCDELFSRYPGIEVIW